MCDPMRPAHVIQAMRPARLARGLALLVHGKPIGKDGARIVNELLNTYRNDRFRVSLGIFIPMVNE